MKGQDMVSFVIPTLNSEKTLGECLDAILAQDFPRSDYEIVIADAGSSDATLEIAKLVGHATSARRWRVSCRLCWNPRDALR